MTASTRPDPASPDPASPDPASPDKDLLHGGSGEAEADHPHREIPEDLLNGGSGQPEESGQPEMGTSDPDKPEIGEPDDPADDQVYGG